MKTEHIVRDYVPETRAVLEAIVAAGMQLVAVNDGEERIDLTSSTGDAATYRAVKAVCAVDEAHVIVRCRDGVKRTLFFVLGNEPGVIVADYTDHPDISSVVDRVADEWQGKAQPTRVVRY